MEEEEAESSALRSLVEAGMQLTGGTLGTVATSTIGGIEGAVVGTALSLSFTRIGNALAACLLSPREQVRVGAAYTFACERVKKNLDAGGQPRTDGYFAPRSERRTAAEEILEGGLLKARDAYEESKLRYIANLVGNMPFSSTSSDEGLLMLEYADSLTYRALACVSLIQRKGAFGLRDTSMLTGGQLTWGTLGVLHEVLNLGQKFLVGLHNPDRAERNLIVGIAEIVPAHLELRPLGEVMYTHMNLHEIPHPDLETLVARHLR